MWRRTSAALFQLSERTLDRIVEAGGNGRRVSAFLRGRLEFAPRPDDIFVVTYPRSGTTWLLYMLHLLVRPEVRFEHISEVCPWFERSLAIGTHQASDFERHPSPRMFKSHLSFGWIPKTGRKIYVIRDGMDVAVSYYNFYRSHLGFQGDFSEFYERFLRGKLQYGSWFKHVAGWQRHRDDPDVLLLDFERLLADPSTILAQTARWCGLPATPERIDTAVQRGSFAAMKKDEEKFDHVTSILRERGLQSRAFIREGRSGAGREKLSPDQLQAFRRRAAKSWAHPEWDLDLAAFLH